ncbi:hypothetical protein Y032_0031g2384 [Ancylostoma ceylanicum]|uniref:Uncharacterized protein n=1 Tax=Ancylostoma ceylanicum TaxID=53326 RepID=A0A016UPH0_9BILA|nr:hypothetical protein Y032_0031g2384 [Ancylostoma ceylanicum]
MVWGGASDLGKAKLVFAQKGVEIYVELHMKQILELSTCSRRKEGTVVLWDQSSVFLDEGCLGIKLTRSQRPGFRCPIYLGMKSLLFPEIVARVLKNLRERSGARIKAKRGHFECGLRYVVENFFVI